MKHATLCLVRKNDHVLLGLKKYDWGEGKWNGFGGKIKKGEAVEETAVRELAEEAGLYTHPDILKKAAVIEFLFNGEAKFRVHIFIVELWVGEPQETDEMTLPKWHPIDRLPFDNMWDADRVWMPEALSDKVFGARIYFTIDGTPGEDEEIFDRIEYDDSLWEN